MSIVRSPRPTENFVKIYNEVARDSRISYRARGLLVRILSNVDDFEMTTIQLAEEATEGRDAVRSAMRELRRFGYAELEKYRKKEGEYDTRTIVFDTPNLNSKDELFLPEPENPASVTGDWKSGVGFSGANKKNSSKKNNYFACMQKNDLENKSKKSPLKPAVNNNKGFEVICGVWCHPRTSGKAKDDYKTTQKMIEDFSVEAVEAASKRVAGSGRKPHPSYVLTELTGNQNAKTKSNCNTNSLSQKELANKFAARFGIKRGTQSIHQF